MMPKFGARTILWCVWWARMVRGAVDDDAAAAAAPSSNQASAAASAASSSSYVVRPNGENEAGQQGELAVDHGCELMRWMERTDGAYFHPHLTIRRMGGGGGKAAAPSSLDAEPESELSSRNSSQPAPAPPSPFYGMYAVDDVAPGELLLEIPRSMVFHPDDPVPGDRVVRYDPADDQYYPGTLRRIDEADGSYTIEYDDDQDDEVETGVDPENVAHEDYPSCCATVHKLVREMRRGGDSFYGPYVQYLLSQPSGQLPTAWSPRGQSLLKRVLGVENPKGEGVSSLAVEEGEEVLQPYGSFGWVEDDWHARCKGGRDVLSENAYLLLAQRGWDEVMIPGRWCTNVCRMAPINLHSLTLPISSFSH
jgi:hypothetical protein